LSSGSIIWIGHASALVEIGGDKVLIDPLGRRRCRAVGGYRAVLITHAHWDHLNRWTLRAVDKDTTLYVPKGAAPFVQDLGFREVGEVEPGDELAVGELAITVVPTAHDAGRWRRGGAPICIGYMIARDGTVIHHAGDVDMSDFALFDDIGRRFSIDVTLLPIGGFLPVWYYRMRRGALDKGVHIDPEGALEVAARLGARIMVPVHYGTVQIPLGPGYTAPRRLAKIAAMKKATVRVAILAPGSQLDVKSGT
jgi:L-ascorbate metabolism protein UlaG (beta-lactamase superfamily)